MTKEVKLLRVHARIHTERIFSRFILVREQAHRISTATHIYTSPLPTHRPHHLSAQTPRCTAAPSHARRRRPPSTAHPPSSRPASHPHPHTMAETSAQQEYPNLNPYTDADADSMNANGAPAPAPALSNGPSGTEQGKSAVSSKVRDTSPVPSCPLNILFPSVCQ